MADVEQFRDDLENNADGLTGGGRGDCWSSELLLASDHRGPSTITNDASVPCKSLRASGVPLAITSLSLGRASRSIEPGTGLDQACRSDYLLT